MARGISLQSNRIRAVVLLTIAATWVGLFLGGDAIAQQFPNTPLPFYGNWCGPGHPRNPANASPPIDPLDVTCMRHDHCIAVQGVFDCGCDISLLTELRNTRWRNPYIQSAARGIYDAIALMPCSDPNGAVYKQTMFMKDLLRDSITGKGTPMDVVNRWQRLVIKP